MVIRNQLCCTNQASYSYQQEFTITSSAYESPEDFPQIPPGVWETELGVVFSASSHSESAAQIILEDEAVFTKTITCRKGEHW